MARTYKTKTIAVPLEIYEALEKKKASERRFGSFNAYVCELLDQLVNGTAGHHVRHLGKAESVRVEFAGFGEKKKHSEHEKQRIKRAS